MFVPGYPHFPWLYRATSLVYLLLRKKILPLLRNKSPCFRYFSRIIMQNFVVMFGYGGRNWANFWRPQWMHKSHQKKIDVWMTNERYMKWVLWVPKRRDGQGRLHGGGRIYIDIREKKWLLGQIMTQVDELVQRTTSNSVCVKQKTDTRGL